MAARKTKAKSYQDKCEQLAFRRKAKIYARRFYRVTFICAVFLIVSLSFWFYNYDTPKTYFSSVMDGFYKMTATTGLKLEKVTFEGNQYTGQEDLVIKLDLMPGKPILGLDLEDLRTKVMQESWVKDAQVQRILPSGLKISINERKPIAIWQLGDKYMLIDSDGQVLTEVDSPDVLPFPLIIGEGANKEAARVFAILGHQKRLYDQVQSAALMGERRWNILFTNGVEVMLPADNMSDAWEKLALMDKNENILNRQVKSIDLRLPDRIYIRTMDGEVIKNSVRNNNV